MYMNLCYCIHLFYCCLKQHLEIFTLNISDAVDACHFWSSILLSSDIVPYKKKNSTFCICDKDLFFMMKHRFKGKTSLLFQCIVYFSSSDCVTIGAKINNDRE